MAVALNSSVIVEALETWPARKVNSVSLNIVSTKGAHMDASLALWLHKASARVRVAVGNSSGVSTHKAPKTQEHSKDG